MWQKYWPRIEKSIRYDAILWKLALIGIFFIWPIGIFVVDNWSEIEFFEQARVVDGVAWDHLVAPRFHTDQAARADWTRRKASAEAEFAVIYKAAKAKGNDYGPHSYFLDMEKAKMLLLWKNTNVY